VQRGGFKTRISTISFRFTIIPKGNVLNRIFKMKDEINLCWKIKEFHLFITLAINFLFLTQQTFFEKLHNSCLKLQR